MGEKYKKFRWLGKRFSYEKLFEEHPELLISKDDIDSLGIGCGIALIARCSICAYMLTRLR